MSQPWIVFCLQLSDVVYSCITSAVYTVYIYTYIERAMQGYCCRGVTPIMKWEYIKGEQYALYICTVAYHASQHYIIVFQLNHNLVHAYTKLAQFNAMVVLLPWVEGYRLFRHNHFIEIHHAVLSCSLPLLLGSGL